MNQTPTQKNGDVDASSSASSNTNGTYVPPARRNQIIGGGNSRNGPRDSAAGNADERFASYRQNNGRGGGYDSRPPRTGSDNMNDRKSAGNSFFDRPTTTSAPRRSKWQDDGDYQSGGSSQGPREDRGGRGRGGRPQVGADGLLPRDTRLEGELFEHHSNTGINFDKYQVRFTFRSQLTRIHAFEGREMVWKIDGKEGLVSARLVALRHFR